MDNSLSPFIKKRKLGIARHILDAAHLPLTSVND